MVVNFVYVCGVIWLVDGFNLNFMICFFFSNMDWGLFVCVVIVD